MMITLALNANPDPNTLTPSIWQAYRIFSLKYTFRHLRTCCIPVLNNYNTDFVRLNTHSNNDSNTQTNVNSGQVTTGTRTSEAPLKLSHVYYNLTCNIRVAHKTITTLRRLLTNVKDKDKPEERQGAVYKIKSQWGGGSYGYRLKFWLYYGYRLIFFSYG